MSRWFRHYAGMMRDEKLVRAALKAGQPVERVVWVWGAILESAAEINDGGRYEIDEAEVAYFLRSDEADVHAVFAALEEGGRLFECRVVKWGDRQFQSDRSAERQKRHRDKQKGRSDGDSERNEFRVHRHGDADVTSPERHGDAPETETETETEKKELRPKRVRTRCTPEFEDFWLAYPRTPVMSKKQAWIEWMPLSDEDHIAARTAVDAYKAWLRSKPDHAVVHACRFLSQRRFEGFATETNGHDLSGRVYVRHESDEWGEYAQRWRDMNHKQDGPPVDKAGGWWFQAA